MSEELTSYKPNALISTSASGALIPQNFEGLYRMATIMAASGFMPKGMEKVESVFVAVQMGLEIGLSPMQAVQNIALINGRPCIWGDAMIGLVRGSGKLEAIKEEMQGEGESTTAICHVWRVGEDDPAIGRFSVADAKRAGLWGKQGPWTQYPKRMLQMRARAFALRDKFADVLKGIYAREEMEGVPEIYMGAADILDAPSVASAMSKHDEPQAEPKPTQEAPPGILLDSRGVPWISGVHTPNQSTNVDGSWRRARNVGPEVQAQREKAAVAALKREMDKRKQPAKEEEPEQVEEASAPRKEPQSGPVFDFAFFRDAIEAAVDLDDLANAEDVLQNCKDDLEEGQFKILGMMIEKARGKLQG